MANHKPQIIQIAATNVVSAKIIATELSQTSWGLFLLEGTARYSNTVVNSAAVDVWESLTAAGTPNHLTFTDNKGRYGVTVKAHVPLLIKVFGR